jgi:outer membrane protein TolC
MPSGGMPGVGLDDLPAVGRGRVAIDSTWLAHLAPPDADDGSAELEYRELGQWQCQCLAAETSSLGNLLASESGVGSQAGLCHRKNQADEAVRSAVLQARSVHERNQSAAQALELFYRLAEAEALADRLDQGLAEIEQALAHLGELTAQGFDVPVDEGALDRQRIALLARRDEARGAARRLDSQLGGLLGFEVEPGLRLWPAADLAVVAEPIDVEAAVGRAMALRGDVAAADILATSADADTLPAIRGGLQSAHPLLGASSGAGRDALLARRAGSAPSAELRTRRDQIAQSRTDTRRAAEREVRDAAASVEGALRQIDWAGQRLDSLARRLKGLEDRREADGVTPFDLHAARLERIEAESDLLRRTVDWKVATVKLKAAGGLLAFECGYRAPGAACR